VLAGLAGMLIAPITEASIGMGNNIIITAFVVIIVGGIGSMKGAFIGALLIGLIDTLGRSFLDDDPQAVHVPECGRNLGPAISAMLIYIIMAAVLALPPAGPVPAEGALSAMTDNYNPAVHAGTAFWLMGLLGRAAAAAASASPATSSTSTSPPGW
jgi:ABC-type branched-subunit amino acid transport system permease subunit